MEQLVRRVAAAGRLCVGVETAARMIHAGALGAVLNLIATAAGTDGNRVLSTPMREAVLGAVISDAPRPEEPTAGPERVAARAVALQAMLPEAAGTFTAAEGGLLAEWLDRLAGQR